MTNDEVKKIVEIFDSADGGCSYCAKHLYTYFIEEFPEHKKFVEEMYLNIWKRILCDEN